jgi:hypothetical protein
MLKVFVVVFFFQPAIIWLILCLQDDILINLVIEQMINDTDPGKFLLNYLFCTFIFMLT